ncbi:hypothetical protein A6456_27635 [Paraburkholderia tropica]|nr:hypothetical protein A6456_27635 [Paraburkholderia tropica]
MTIRAAVRLFRRRPHMAMVMRRHMARWGPLISRSAVVAMTGIAGAAFIVVVRRRPTSIADAGPVRRSRVTGSAVRVRPPLVPALPVATAAAMRRLETALDRIVRAVRAVLLAGAARKTRRPVAATVTRAEVALPLRRSVGSDDAPRPIFLGFR